MTIDYNLGEDALGDDAELWAWLAGSSARRQNSLSLISSENYPLPAAVAAYNSGMVMANSEGYPPHIEGAREFYAGDKNALAVQTLAIDRATQLFGCRYANVQPFSGSLANSAAIQAMVGMGDTVLKASFESGAGHFTQGDKEHASGRGLKLVEFGVTPDGYIDYDDLEKKAIEHAPRLIIVGGSGYPRAYDYARIGAIAKKSGAKLMLDMAQISGLVAAGVHPSPFPHADIVTSSTHKTLGGLRSGMILWNDEKLSKPINDAVFPGLQGEPDNAKIAAQAALFYQARSEPYRRTIRQMVKNAQTMAALFQARGIKLVTDGTDNHIVLIDLRPLKLEGGAAAEQLREIGLLSNKMPIPGDKKGEYSGLRLGTPSITNLGFKEADCEKLAHIIVQFVTELSQGKRIDSTLQNQVAELVKQFPPPKFPFQIADPTAWAERLFENKFGKRPN